VRRASGISSESCPAGESIAAVPFENLNSEQNSAFLALEMNDDPLTKSAKIPDMKVGRSATTAVPFVETGQTAAIEQYRTAPKIVKARQWHKRVVRVRTLWHKLLYV
jgi:TolB-like protein